MVLYAQSFELCALVYNFVYMSSLAPVGFKTFVPYAVRNFFFVPPHFQFVDMKIGVGVPYQSITGGKFFILEEK